MFLAGVPEHLVTVSQANGVNTFLQKGVQEGRVVDRYQV